MLLEQPKIHLFALLILLVIILTGCNKNSNIIDEKIPPVQIQVVKTKNEPSASIVVKDDSSIEEPEIDNFDKLGITIQLPKNINWIENPTYSIIDETIAQVNYYDKIVEVDMTLRVGKEDIQTLSGLNYSFDDKREESWFAKTFEGGKGIDIKVQYTASDQEMNAVLASWNYKEFNYVLWGIIPDKEIDTLPIAKTAVYIAKHMK